MEKKDSPTSLPEFTKLTHEDKLIHFILLTENGATDEQTQLACLKMLRKTFGIQPPAQKKD